MTMNASRALAAPIAPVAIHPYDESLRITAAAIRRDRTRAVENGLIPVVMTASSEDRHGSTIRPSAWAKRIASFIANPVMQWAHISWIPTVGNVVDLQADGNTWVALLKFATKSWSGFGGANLAQLLEDLMNDDMLHAVSPGFIPHEVVERKAKDMPQWLDPENVEYTDVELTEISPCNVPSNREALQKSLQRGSVSESGLRALIQLGVIPRIFDDAPIAIMARDAIAPEPKELLMSTPEIMRMRIAEVFTRCGCEPYHEPKPEVITPEQTTAELALMNELAASLLTTLDVSFRGWKATVASLQRNFYTNLVVDSLYRIEGLIWHAREWYDAELDIVVPDMSVGDISAVVAEGGASTLRNIAAVRRHAVPSAARAVVRAEIADALRCCGCDSFVEEAPVLPTDQAVRDTEITILQSLADEAMFLLEVALDGWKKAQTDRLHEYCSSRVYDSMWLYDICARWLKEWYDVEVAGVPNLNAGDLTRALQGFDATRAGAVFARKNLEKIDQVITIMGELRAAANKPTVDDVPEGERAIRETFEQFCARMANESDVAWGERMTRVAEAMMQRIAGPFEYGSTQVNLAGDTAQKVLAQAAVIPDDVLAEKGRETDPHVTVKFGIDASITADQIKEALAVSDTVREIAQRGATMTLGKTEAFTADATEDDSAYDVVYIAVDSPDLVELNSAIATGVTTTDTQSDYIPHITLAYVKAGEGQNYVGDATLDGTVVTFDSIAFSDTEGNIVDIALTEAAAARTAAPTMIRIKSGETLRKHDVLRHPIRVLAPDASRDRSEESPTLERSLYIRLMND